MKIIRSQDCRRTQWKNGRGSTVEIIVSPDKAGYDAFDWRISTADVTESGPFSTFPDIDRTIAVLSENSLDLHVEGCPPVRLSRESEPYAFPGGVTTVGRLVSGPVRDFNMMSRCGRVAHAVKRIAFDALMRMPRNGDFLVIYAESGWVAVEAGARREMLNAGDTFLVDRVIAECKITPQARARVIAVDVKKIVPHDSEKLSVPI